MKYIDDGSATISVGDYSAQWSVWDSVYGSVQKHIKDRR